MDLGVSGLASGFDWRSLVDQLSEVERSPQRLLLQEQSQLEQRNTAYGSLRTQLSVLQNKVKVLQDSTLFSRRLTSVGDEAIFKVAKDIVVKFIEVGRLTPSSFEETFYRVYKAIERTVRSQ